MSKKNEDPIITKSYSLPQSIAERVEELARADHYRHVSHYVERILRDHIDAKNEAA